MPRGTWPAVMRKRYWDDSDSDGPAADEEVTRLEGPTQQPRNATRTHLAKGAERVCSRLVLGRVWARVAVRHALLVSVEL